MNKIKTLIVDDHDIVLLGLKALLSKSNEIEIVAVATTGEEAIAKVGELKPDVVLLDVNLPATSGIEVTEYITRNYPEVKVLLHTSYDDEELIVGGFEAGAAGYILKTFKPEQLIEAIGTVKRGEKYIKGSVSDILITNYFKIKNNKDKEVDSQNNRILTKREIEIIKFIAEGISNQKIGETLGISVRTVEVHKYNIMKKLEIHNTAGLVKYALINNIISL